MGARFFGSATTPRSSMGSPSRLNIRPSVCLPIGTVMGPPVSSAFMPRTRPSVESSAMHRTVLLPRCDATSQVMLRFRPASLIFSAL